MYIMTEEDELRERMIEREEYYALQKYLEDRAKRADEVEVELKTIESELKTAKTELKATESELKETKNVLKEKDKKIEELEKLLNKANSHHSLTSHQRPIPLKGMGLSYSGKNFCHLTFMVILYCLSRYLYRSLMLSFSAGFTINLLS